jgi:LCP family protein required for cell wall assembly
MLLLGYRGAGMSGGAYLTDTMMLTLYNPGKQSAVLLSIPRDIWVGYSDSGVSSGASNHKINEAFAMGGGALSKKVVSQLFGYDVQSYFGVDFNDFQKAINEVGGIDVNVPQAFGDFKAGPQHFDGARALEYARIRSVDNNPSESSDFARSRRQRQVIEAFAAKVRTPGGLLHLVPLLKLATSAVKTDFKLPSIGDLTTIVRTSGDTKFHEVGLSTSNYFRIGTSDEGLYILTPSSRTGSWDQIRGLVDTLVANPAAGTSMASHHVTLVNATGGAANNTLRDYAESLGCQVATVQTGQARDTTLINAGTDDKELAEFLRVALEKKGIAAQVQVSGNGSPSILFGRDWKGG